MEVEHKEPRLGKRPLPDWVTRVQQLSESVSYECNTGGGDEEEEEYDDGTAPTHDEKIQLCFDCESLKTYRSDVTQLCHISELFTESATDDDAAARPAVRHSGDC